MKTKIRFAAAFPLYVLGAIVWICAAAILIPADGLSGRKDGARLLGLFS